MYNACDIAKQILYAGHELGVSDLSNLKLQKLVYFANITYLSIAGEPLFSDKVVAKDYGPLVWSVYHNYNKFGNSPITDSVEKTKDYLLEELVDFVMDSFGMKSPSVLVDISHEDPIYINAKDKEDKTMVHTKEDATKIVSKNISRISSRANYISLASKMNDKYVAKDHEYIDEFAGKSEKELMEFWGIAQ